MLAHLCSNESAATALTFASRGVNESYVACCQHAQSCCICQHAQSCCRWYPTQGVHQDLVQSQPVSQRLSRHLQCAMAGASSCGMRRAPSPCCRRCAPSACPAARPRTCTPTPSRPPRTSPSLRKCSTSCSRNCVLEHGTYTHVYIYIHIYTYILSIFEQRQEGRLQRTHPPA